VVEIPWILERLRKYSGGKEKVLAVGDVISQTLAKSGYGVEVVDMDAESSPGQRLKVQKLDIREAKLPPNYFDIAVSISTLEHIGIQTIEFEDGDRLACEIIGRSINPGGLFLFTVPFGKAYISKGLTRIYDRQRLSGILEGLFATVEESYYIWNGLKWKQVSLYTAEKAGFLKDNPDKYPAQNIGLAMVVARKL
jgi:hypothetical protein